MQELETLPRVVILDPSPVSREALARALKQDGIAVLAAVATADELLHAIAACLPDVVVVDAPEVESTVLRMLHGRQPPVHVVVLSSGEPGRAERCFHEGATAYLFKLETGLETLGLVIRSSARGEFRFPWGSEAPPPQSAMPSPGNWKLQRLTPRERQVLAHVAAGHDNLKIAALLNISERTVKSHVISVYRKLDAENRVQLALLAGQLGVTPVRT